MVASRVYLHIDGGSCGQQNGIISEDAVHAVPHCRDDATCQQACKDTPHCCSTGDL